MASRLLSPDMTSTRRSVRMNSRYYKGKKKNIAEAREAIAV
jgi:hypothetical protein